MRPHILCLLLSLTATVGASERIEHRFMDGTATFEVDNTKVRVDALKRYLVVHPIAYDSKYHLARELRLCIESDPAYKACGTRDLRAEHFFENAETNIRLSKADLAYLESLKEYPELQPLVNHFRRSLRFSLWKVERLLAYYRTWDAKELERDFESLPVIEETKEIVAKLKRATDEGSRWHVSYYEWQNASNHLYRNQEGKPPAEAWKRFLRAHQIKETIVYDDVD